MQGSDVCSAPSPARARLGLCWGNGDLQRGSKVPQLPQEGCVEFQGRGKGRDHRVLPALAVLNPKFLWCSALAGS